MGRPSASWLSAAIERWLSVEELAEPLVQVTQNDTALLSLSVRKRLLLLMLAPRALAIG